MKRYLTDFFVGFGLGLILFLGSSYFLGGDPLSLAYPYYFFPILFFIIYASTPYFKRRIVKGNKMLKLISSSIIVFLFGFLLPFLFWAYVFYSALLNWTLF